MVDLVLHRYGSASETVFRMPFTEGFDLVLTAIDAAQSEQLWLMYCVSMIGGQKKSFESFKKDVCKGGKSAKRPVTDRSANDILKDAEIINQRIVDKKKREGGANESI